MKKAEIDWKPSAVQLLLLGDKVEEGGGKKSEDIIGIKLSLLKKIGKHTELKCLRLFLSLLEATTDVVAHTIHKSLREGEFHFFSFIILLLFCSQTRTNFFLSYT
jgi:hypothetical protein